MISRLIAKIGLYFSPPQKGDVYYGNPFDFIIGNKMEQNMHGLRNISGDPLWHVTPSNQCYRLTIKSRSMPFYYICRSEVLATDWGNPSRKEWLKRAEPRRIPKEKFHELILNGSLEKL